MVGHRPCWAATALITALSMLLAAAAQARPSPPLPERAARIEDNDGRVRLSVAYPELLDAALQKKVDGGLAATFVARAYLQREGAPRAESLAVQTTRVAYDLWDEVYVVEVTDDSGRHVYRERRRVDALFRVAGIDRLAVAERAQLVAGARYRITVIVEVNPVSPQLLEQVRRWLARPQRGAGGVVDESESYFGALAGSLIQTRVGDAEKVLRFRTPPFAPTGGAR
jgi:hypothetical protein